MVLRTGIIIPFQFRDTKKLLMIGGPNENRDLSVWDLKNVVRSAFGIYNFEFRNKKIGFNIPEELILHYLAQRHDLTNFVIEINQANDEINVGDTKEDTPLPQRSHESGTNEYLTTSPSSAPLAQNSRGSENSSIDHITINHSPGQISNANQTQKQRTAHTYSQHTAESLTQSINPTDILTKSDGSPRYYARPGPQTTATTTTPIRLQTPTQQQQTPTTPHGLPHQLTAPQFFSNYAHSLLGNSAPNTPMRAPSTPIQVSYTASGIINRFRKRGERMSKDQKDLYVKFLEENPCILSSRRNDGLMEPLWTKLASILNSVPQGAVKNVEEWKQTFDAWRYRIFMYMRYNSKLSGNDAQDPKNYKPLTATDQRAYAMWTNHKHVAPQDFEKMEMFNSFEETTTSHADYDY